jgi:hypothetical protein
MFPRSECHADGETNKDLAMLSAASEPNGRQSRSMSSITVLRTSLAESRRLPMAWKRVSHASSTTYGEAIEMPGDTILL